MRLKQCVMPAPGGCWPGKWYMRNSYQKPGAHPNARPKVPLNPVFLFFLFFFFSCLLHEGDLMCLRNILIVTTVTSNYCYEVLPRN